MNFSRKAVTTNLSPMRKFYPYAKAAKEAGKKIYQLNIGQPDIVTPSVFMEAIRNFSQEVLDYAPSPGIPSLIAKIQGYYKKMGIDYTEDDILVTTGGSEGIYITMSCLLDDGDEVIVPEPFYPNYNVFIRSAGGQICPINTRVEEGYAFASRERIESLVGPRTKAILITNPGNPTGVMLTKEEMEMIADIAVEHDLFLVCDEVYREFFYNGEGLLSMGMFEKAAQNVIIIDSVSKRFSATGARIGCLISKNQEFMEHALKYCQGRLSAPTLEQIGACALYDMPEEYYEKVREEYKKRRDTVVAALKKIPGVTCATPNGAFYLMARLPVADTDKFQKWLLEKFSDNNETVMFSPGEGFYETKGRGKDEIRIAYVLKCEDLERAIELLAKGLKEYNKK